jgi:hypothetical protein
VVLLAYVDRAFFEAHSTMNPADVDAFEVAWPGRLATLFASWSRFVDGLLRKVYVVPLQEPAPIEVRLAVVRIVTAEAFKILGYRPGSSEKEVSDADAAAALASLKELAAADGRLELPLKDEAPEAEGPGKGAPLGYSETSPWTWTDIQREEVDA